MFQLVVQEGDRRGETFSLPASGQVRVGRARDCEIHLDIPGVSRLHAVLVGTEEGWSVRDQGSLNGTLINGERMELRSLREGDRIGLGGNVVLRFLAVEDDPWLGRTCGGYRIEALIGKGGMGRVYRATQLAMERTVALKILSRELSENRQLVESFVQEARAAAKLSHPHVVKIHDVKEEDGVYFIAMEYLEKGTLHSELERHGSIEPQRLLPMLIDAAKALIWAEEHAIVHRDIKPGNLLLDGRGRVKVADFGIATELRGEGGQVGARVAGSPHFMAPEQAGTGPIDHRADIYALGATAYRALSGVVPFEGSDARSILRRKIAEDPVPLDRVVSGLPVGLSAIVQKMMARAPEERYQSARDVVKALSAMQRRLLARAAPQAGPRTKTPPTAPGMPAPARGGGGSPKPVAPGSARVRGGARPARRATGPGRGATTRARPTRGGKGSVGESPAKSPSKVSSSEASPREELPRAAATGRRPSSQSTPVIVALVVVAIAVVGIGLWWVTRPDPRTRSLPESSTAGTEGLSPAPGEESPRSPLDEAPPPGARSSPPASPSSPTDPTDRSEPPGARDDADALKALALEVELALLESRFGRARALLEEARTLQDPSEMRQQLAKRLAAAERLFRARREALQLQRGGDVEGALRLLRGLEGKLPGPFDDELEAALRSLEGRSAASGVGS